MDCEFLKWMHTHLSVLELTVHNRTSGSQGGEEGILSIMLKAFCLSYRGNLKLSSWRGMGVVDCVTQHH